MNGDVHYFIKIILLLIKVAECGQQRLNVKMLSLRSSAVLCVVVKIYMITSDIRSKCMCSKCFRRIPYILCGSLNEWLHTCQACIITTWRLELQAPLVARDYPLYKYKHVNIHLFQLKLLPWTVFHSLHCTMINSCSGKFSLVHVHWNNGDHLWKAFKRAFKSNGC